MTEEELRQLFERLRRAQPCYEVWYTAASLARGVAPDRYVLDALDALWQVYGVSPAINALQLYRQDCDMLEEVLRSTALELGEHELATMSSIRRAVWWRYLDPGHDNAQAQKIAREVTSFSYALAAWLVFTSEAPYPAFPEELPIWQDTPLGSPPTPPPPPPVQPPGGIQDLDAGADAGDLGPPRLRWQRWHRWAPGSNDGQRYARYTYPQSDSDAKLRHLLVAPELGGHPLLALVKEVATPAQVYDLLTSHESRRAAGVRVLIRRIDRLLEKGCHELEQGVRAQDRDTVNELWEAAKWALFPEGPPKRRDRPLHELADQLKPETTPQVVAEVTFDVTLGLSLIFSLATFGIPAAVLEAVDVGVNVAAGGVNIGSLVAFAIERDERARAHRRFEAIDQTLRRAEATDDITAQVALQILFVLAPPALGRLRRGAAASARSGLLRRVLARLSRSVRRARPAQLSELTGAAAAGESQMTRAVAQAPRQAERAVAGRATRAAPHDPRAPDPRAIQSRAVEPRARGTASPRTRGTLAGRSRIGSRVRNIVAAAMIGTGDVRALRMAQSTTGTVTRTAEALGQESAEAVLARPRTTPAAPAAPSPAELVPSRAAPQAQPTAGTAARTAEESAEAALARPRTTPAAPAAPSPAVRVPPRAAPRGPRAPDPRAIQSRAVEPRARGTTDRGLDDELDNAFREWPTETPTTEPAAVAEERLRITGFLVSPAQERTLGRLLDRLMSQDTERAVVSALDPAHRAALETAERQAADLLRRIRTHWDAALPRGWTSVVDVADRVFQKLLSAHPGNPNRWVRGHFFNPWRVRFMRRIGNDRTLVHDLNNHAGLVVARDPRTGTVSLLLPARAEDGRRVDVRIDLDHGVISHRDAVRRALEANESSYLISTVDLANLQLMTARHNRIVIERLRAEAGQWQGPTAFRPGEPIPPTPSAPADGEADTVGSRRRRSRHRGR